MGKRVNEVVSIQFNAMKRVKLNQYVHLLEIVVVVINLMAPGPLGGRLGRVVVGESVVADALICARVNHRRVAREVSVLVRRHAQTLLEWIHIARAVHVLRVGAGAREARVGSVAAVSLVLERRRVRLRLAAEDDVGIRKLPLELVTRARLTLAGRRRLAWLRVLSLNGVFRGVHRQRWRPVRVIKATCGAAERWFC